MKNEILKLFYNQVEDLVNKFILKFDGHPEQMKINIVASGFLKFVHDELGIE